MPGKQWPSAKPAEMNKFYGNPMGSPASSPSAKWERENIVSFTPPHPLYYPLTTVPADRRKTRLKTIRVHKRCKDSLYRILKRIGDECTPEEIKKYELDICGGVYNYRLMRGSSKSLSIHSWGAAIDLSHIINAWKKKWKGAKGGMMPEKVIQIFEDEGWTFGGVWSTADAMHFQAANEGNQKRTTSASQVYGIMAPPAEEDEAPDVAQDVGPAGLPDDDLVEQDAPARTAPAPQVAVQTMSPKDTIIRVQDLLKKRGYAYVGASDGILGPNTEAAIFAFRKANNLPPYDGTIDEGLIAALVAGEDKQIAPERAQATTEQAAAKSEPVAQVVQTTTVVKKENESISFWGWLVGLPSIIGSFIMSALEHLGVAKETLDPIKNAFGKVDPKVWWFLVGAVVIFFVIRSRRAAKAAEETKTVVTNAYQEGKVN